VTPRPQPEGLTAASLSAGPGDSESDSMPVKSQASVRPGVDRVTIRFLQLCSPKWLMYAAGPLPAGVTANEF
jgi:hypothetical protein